MREIQELTLVIAHEGSGLDQTIDTLLASAQRFGTDFYDRLEGEPVRSNLTVQMVATPLDRIWIDNVVQNEQLQQARPVVQFEIMKSVEGTDYPWGREYREPRPIVRGERRTMSSGRRGLMDEIYCNGSVVLAMESPGDTFYAAWFISQLAATLVTIERMRTAGSAVEIEYALEIVIEDDEDEVPVRFSFGKNVEFYLGTHSFVPRGRHRLPRYSVGPIAERAALIDLVLQDVQHLVGRPASLISNVQIRT